jgi:hypothetical protein
MLCDAFGRVLDCDADHGDELDWSHLRAFEGRLSRAVHLEQMKRVDSAVFRCNELVAIDTSRCRRRSIFLRCGMS